MATVYFRDGTEPVESERVFIAENMGRGDQ